MFLASVLSRPDAVGTSVVRGTISCHGTITIRIFRHCLGACEVNIWSILKKLYDGVLGVNHKMERV